MAFVITNEDGEFYGGFDSVEARPVWYGVKRKNCYLDEPVADLVLKQLGELGFTKLKKKYADPPPVHQ